MIISIDTESVCTKNSSSHHEKIRNKVRKETFSPLLFTIVLKKLPSAMGQEKILNKFYRMEGKKKNSFHLQMAWTFWKEILWKLKQTEKLLELTELSKGGIEGKYKV